jgi:hypothetical protein
VLVLLTVLRTGAAVTSTVPQFRHLPPRRVKGSKFSLVPSREPEVGHRARSSIAFRGGVPWKKKTVAPSGRSAGARTSGHAGVARH